MKQPILGTNILDWKEHWDHFNIDLYVKYLIAQTNNEYEKR